MIREIKFRGIEKETKEFVYGELIKTESGWMIVKYKNIDITASNVGKKGRNYYGSFIAKEIIVDSLGQFTGLKDNNNKDIYEGDLLIDRYPIDENDLSKGYYESLLPVVWCKNSLMWCVDCSFNKDVSYLTSLVEYFSENLEIKGNIFEKTK